MSMQQIDIGALANDGSGDALRDAFSKANQNFSELYSLVNFNAGGLADLSQWQTGVLYQQRQIVVENFVIYKALIQHGSGNFATDLANGKWIAVATLPAGQDGNPGTPGANTPASNVSNDSGVVGSSVKDALETLQSVKADASALGSAAAHPASDFATSAQGLKADSALQTSNIGSGPGNLVALDGSAKLPAVDASQLINVPGNGASLDRSVVFGGVPDCRIVTDAAMSATSNVLTSATAAFTAGDVGKVVSVAGAGSGGNALVAAITVFTNSTTVTLGSSSTGAVSGARLAVGTNNSTALNAAITSAGSGSNIIIPNGNYLFLNQIVLPQGKRIRFTGTGAGSTAFFFGSDGAALFNYTRTSGQVDAIYEFFDLAFYTVSLAKKAGSAALYSYGYSDADALNMLRVHRCWFFGWEKAISSKWTGQSKVHNCYFSQNTYSVFLLRGCSFWDFNANMSGDATFLYAVDTTHDAYSNGLFIRSSHAVGSAAESVVIEGYQAVWIEQCGFDGGTGGVSSLLLTSVIDFTISACYISSNNSTTRFGIAMSGSVRGHISHNTIVNNNIGVNIIGVNGTATRITTFDNTFDGQDKNDVVWSNYATCCKHIANHHSRQMSRTGTNYEFWGNSTGVDFGVIAQNTFKGATYTITAGASTQQANNIFGVTSG